MAARPIQMSPGHEVDLLLANELLGSGGASRAGAIQDPPGLHVCPDCALPFVVPGEVREVVGADSVRLDLVCTNCRWTGTETHDDAALTALDVQLDRSFADLLWTLEIVWVANEESAIARFAEALEADAILPEDF